jgi:hypothetical protein
VIIVASTPRIVTQVHRGAIVLAMIATMCELTGLAALAVALGVALGWPWALFAIGLGLLAVGVLLDSRPSMPADVEAEQL